MAVTKAPNREFENNLMCHPVENSFLLPSFGHPLLQRLLDPLCELDVFRDAQLLQPRRVHRGVVWPLCL